LILERVRRVAGARPDLLERAIHLFDAPGHLRGCRGTGPMVCSGEPYAAPGPQPRQPKE
jgi:hypothetical protein